MTDTYRHTSSDTRLYNVEERLKTVERDVGVVRRAVENNKIVEPKQPHRHTLSVGEKYCFMCAIFVFVLSMLCGITLSIAMKTSILLGVGYAFIPTVVAGFICICAAISCAADRRK